MSDLIRKELLEEDDNYLILHNGEIIDHSPDISSLNFSDDIELIIIHIISTDTTININVESNVSVKISEVFYQTQNNFTININLNISKNAKLDYLTFIKSANDATISAIVNTNLDANSYINYKSLSTLSSNADVRQNVYLNGPNAMVEMKNVIINSSSKLQVYTTDIYHNKENTSSNVKNFGIVNNDSSLNINSNGIIKIGAKKSELKQKAKGLILDMNSKISANPMLEINDFDCIAAHGASIGAIDEGELYYLMSRGLTRQDSEKLIVSGFIYPFLTEINEGKFQDYLKSWININI